MSIKPKPLIARLEVQHLEEEIWKETIVFSFGS
jgi:hypothetical protein